MKIFLLTRHQIKILVIYRENEILIPTGKVEIYPGDEIYFLVRSNELKSKESEIDIKFLNEIFSSNN